MEGEMPQIINDAIVSNNFILSFFSSPAGDCWVRLAALVNFLEEHSFWKVPIVTGQDEGKDKLLGFKKKS